MIPATRKLVVGACAALAFALLTPFASAKDDDVDPAAREWSQARGNSGRSSGSAVEPLRGEPADAWKQPLPGAPLADPVTWGGVVFVAAQKDKTRKLLAFRASTGEPLGEKDLGSGGRVGLATWSGVVLVQEATQIRTFPHQVNKFGSGWSARGTFSAPPCVYRGYAFVCDGAEILCLDIMRGGAKKAKAPVADMKSLTSFEETKSLKGEPVGGAVGVFKSKSDGALYAVNVATFDNVALLSRTRVDDLAGAKTQMRYTNTEVIGVFDGAVPEDDRWSMIPCRIEGDSAKAPGAWMVLAPRPFKGGGTGRFVPDAAKASGVNLVTAPAVLDAVAYSFTPSGDLQSWRASGRTETLVQSSNAPPGSKPGPATRAGGVVFVGNWAVEIEAGRVIWSVKHEPATAMVPAGDKRLVFATRSELVCVADPSVIQAAPAAGAAGATTAAAPAVVKMPVDMDGVLLSDGRQIEGTCEKSGRTTYTIQPKDGSPPFEVGVTQIVVAEKGGQVEHRGDDGDAFRVWRSAVRNVYCDAMETIFQDYAKGSLVDDARRVMQRMRENGATESRMQKLDSALNGKAPRTDAARSKRNAVQEEAARAALFEGFLLASEWCRKREFETAATAALNELGRLRGGVDADIEARAKTLIPDSFPWKDAPDAVKQWMKWADALLPVGAEFIDRSDDAWDRLSTEPWKSGGPLAFRTRNILLYCMDQDVAVCGRAVQLAEGTVRAVQSLLNDGEAEEVMGDSDRLEVRIHKDRKSYLAEQGSTGKAPEWSAGYFSPAEGISRFYVERNSSKDGAPDLAELGRVLTHELTHHYMEVRWMHRASGGGPGYWVIEGMATFVENQAVQMDRRGLSFNDDTVPNLDAMSQIQKAFPERIFKMERFVDMSHGDFDPLSNEFLGRVKLRNSFEEKGFTERGLWYDQAGALCYFFLFKRGEDGRKNFVDYVRLHYRGNAPRPGWRFLGYENAEDLDKEFGDFLRSLRGG